MALLSIQDVHLTYGGTPLLEGVTLHVNGGDRLCLLGRNGTGKSTMLRIAAGVDLPDRGTVTPVKGSTVAFLHQDLPQGLTGTALQVASGLGQDRTEQAGATTKGNTAPPRPTAAGAGTTTPDQPAGPAGPAAPNHDPETAANRQLAAEQALTRLGVPLDQPVEQMSGGAIRRVLLARVLAAEADLLLLDEPTNHLDIDTILWLEDYLIRRSKSGNSGLVYVTHDRAFARRLATRVAELDRGSLITFSGGYDEFITRREELLESEQKARERFDKKLAEEEAWLRKGVKARRTRNEGRVRALMRMRDEYDARRKRLGNAEFNVDAGGRSGDLVIQAKNVAFGYDEGLEIVRDFSTVVLRGDKIGIAGPNGTGKTTLVRLLLGELTPQSGKIRRGTGIAAAYFDQMRSLLTPDSTVFDNIGEGYDTVSVGGKKRHVMAYLEDFLFSSSDINKKAGSLSGGEQNRLMLAKLFCRPANLLVLDEPTNDLDLETLELLEEAMSNYQGTVLLVSHDRDFLDNVVTECLVLPGDGQILSYAGGYQEWRSEKGGRPVGQARVLPGIADRDSASSAAGRRNGADSSGDPERGRPRKRDSNKLSFNETRELAELPDRIADLESERDRIHHLLSSPDLYKSGGSSDMPSPAELTSRLSQVESQLADAYDRWEELEARNAK